MLRVHQIPLPLDATDALDEAALRVLCAGALGVDPGQVAAVTLVKRSLDARDKGDVHFVLTADVALLGGEKAERALAQKYKPNRVALQPPGEPMPDRGLLDMALPPWVQDGPRPIVVGAGPAGLFCALALAKRGAKPLLIERGQPVEQRMRDVEAFEAQAMLSPESNVLFGEGGAGAFSDGKLTCGLNNPKVQVVLRTLVACGAPQDILTAQRPHIGTDMLRRVLVSLRKEILARGGEVLFGHRLEALRLRHGRLNEALVLGPVGLEQWEARHLYLSIGHSARDTYTWLHSLGLPMEAKPFAVGLRIEHLQQQLNRAQYGPAWPHPALPPAEYKLNVHTPDGRGVYTFCMCPGGQVIGAVSEAGCLNVNGMSLHARDGANGNAALLVGVRPEDFQSDHPLAGVAFQRHIEEAAFGLAGDYLAPCQRVADFMAARKTTALGAVQPTYRPGIHLGNVADCLPSFMTNNLRYALPRLGQRLRGFDDGDALLTAPETRSSAPVRLLRGPQRESPVRGIFPLGEGAGYAGGIVSAAMDGMAGGMGDESPAP